MPRCTLRVLTGALVGLGLFSFFHPVASHAADYYFLDFDNTIVETRPEFGGTFKTGFKLFRIEQRANALQSQPEGPKQIVVTPGDFDKIKRHLGQGPNQPGALSIKVKLEDGSEVIPGHYMVVVPDTYEYFRPTDRRSGEKYQNHALENFKAAERASVKGEFKGPAWSLLEILLSDKETANRVGITSARWMKKKSFRRFFEGYLVKEKKYFKYAPNFELSSFVDGPDFDRYDLHGSVTKKKVSKLADFALALSRVPLEPGETHHSITFYEDNQRTMDFAFETFKQIAQSKRTKVKFVLLNAGTDEEVKASGRPRYLVINPDGTHRAATKDDLAGLEPSQCEAYLVSRKVSVE